MNKKIVFYSLLFMPLSAADIGSNSAVTRFNTTQVVTNGSSILGFAALAGGFALDSIDTIGTFNSFFPVSGLIVLNYATLILQQDLILHNLSYWITFGKIMGNFHTIEFAPNIDCIPLQSDVIGDCRLSALTISSVGDAVNSVDWYLTDTAIAIGMDRATTNQLEIYRFFDPTVAPTFVTGVQIPPLPAASENVYTVRWHPNQNWIAVGCASSANNELFIYSFNGTSLTLLSSANIGGAGQADVLAVAWHPDGDFLAVACQRNTQELQVFPVSGAGVLGAPTIQSLGGTIANAVEWNPSAVYAGGTYLAVGTAKSGGFDELRVYTFTKPSTLTLNATFDVGADVTSISWNPSSIVNTNVLAVATAGTGGQRLKAYQFSPGSITDLNVALQTGTSVYEVAWQNDGVCVVAGIANNAEGTGGEIRLYSFVNNDYNLQSDLEIGADTNAVRWSRSGLYLASGNGDNTFRTAGLNSNVVDTTNVFFIDLKLAFNNNITFKDTSITFSGQSTIDGRGNTLTMSPTFTLLLYGGSSLLLKDITIEGVNDSRIIALSNTSTFSLQNVTFVLDSDFTFTQGILDILGDFKIAGANRTFIYTSNQQTTIRGAKFGTGNAAPSYNGTLMIDHNVTFSYAPANNSANLISLESTLSKIMLVSGTLFANTLNLTKGVLTIDGASTIQGRSNITLGDGTAANNLTIELLPAANLNMLGNITYNNV